MKKFTNKKINDMLMEDVNAKLELVHEEILSYCDDCTENKVVFKEKNKSVLYEVEVEKSGYMGWVTDFDYKDNKLWECHEVKPVRRTVTTYERV